MPYVDFTGNRGKIRVNYREVEDVAHGKSNIYIDSVQVLSTVFYGVVYYACGKILIGGQVALDMDGTSTYTSGYMESTDVWYTIDNSSTSTPIQVTNNGKTSTTTIGLGPHGNYNDFNVWCISDRRGDIEISPSSQTVNLYRLPTYSLSISAGTGSSITVKRGSETLSNGATIYYSDVLNISFGTSTGYNLGTHTVNGTTFTSGNSHTVTAAVSVVSTASVKSFTLSISAGTGSTIAVNRTSSPLKGAATGNLSNNATIYYNDVLKITFAASTGYNLGTHTVNGTTFTSGNSHTVTAAVSVTSTASLKTFTLSISAGTGSTITVKRNGTTLSNGATITYGDSLVITFGTSTGYNIGTHTVNGTTFTSGNTHTVTAAVAVVSTASVKSFTLSISAGTGSTITVNRTSSPLKGATTGNLSNNATIYYSDVLKITFSTSTGYNLGTHTVNGTTFTSGNSHTVTAAVSVISTATVKSFTLSISAGTGSGIVVNRTSSPLKNASTGTLSNGAAVYYNDVLKITFSVSIGYDLSTHKVNNSTFTSGNSHTVTAAVSVISTATVKQFTLTKTAGTGTVITVTRTYSPLKNAATGELSNGASIYYSDTLTITVSASPGYVLQTAEMNGGSIQTPYSVSNNVTIVATALAAGAYIRNVSSFVMYQIIIKGQQFWDLYRPMIFNGNTWENY